MKLAPDVALVGVGAVGGCLAGHLLAAGKDPLLCVRTPFTRIVVRWPEGGHDGLVPTRSSPGGLAPARLVLLATKAHETPGAARWLRALCGPGTLLAVLQNGVEHEARVAPWAARAEVLPVVVDCPAERLAPGRIVQSGAARLTVPAGDGAGQLAELFADTDVEVVPVEDFTTAAWRKLCTNVASGALTALTGRPMGVFREPEIARLAEAVVEECARVGRVVGADLEDGIGAAVSEALGRAPAKQVPSMLADRLAGRPLEVEARNGAVARIAASHGVAAPYNTALAALLDALGDGASGPHG